MTYKTTSALIAAMTLAFTAPAFAGSTPPANDPTQVETIVETEVTVETETDATTDTLLTKTPLAIDSEVAGEVITSDEVFAPTLGEPETELTIEDKVDADLDIEIEADDFEADLDVDADLKIEPEVE